MKQMVIFSYSTETTHTHEDGRFSLQPEKPHHCWCAHSSSLLRIHQVLGQEETRRAQEGLQRHLEILCVTKEFF
jgi:hypothetical protein